MPRQGDGYENRPGNPGRQGDGYENRPGNPGRQGDDYVNHPKNPGRQGDGYGTRPDNPANRMSPFVEPTPGPDYGNQEYGTQGKADPISPETSYQDLTQMLMEVRGDPAYGGDASLANEQAILDRMREIEMKLWAQQTRDAENSQRIDRERQGAIAGVDMNGDPQSLEMPAVGPSRFAPMGGGGRGVKTWLGRK